MLGRFPCFRVKKRSARTALLQTELHTFYNSYSKLHRVVEFSIWRCRFQPRVPWAHCKHTLPGQQNAYAKGIAISLLLYRDVSGNAVKLLSPPINWLKIKTSAFQFSFSSEHPASCLHLLYLADSFSTLQKRLLKYTNSNLQFHFIFLLKQPRWKYFSFSLSTFYASLLCTCAYRNIQIETRNTIFSVHPINIPCIHLS